MEKYMDKHLPAKERAADLLGRMSLEEKMEAVSAARNRPGEYPGIQKL